MKIANCFSRNKVITLFGSHLNVLNCFSIFEKVGPPSLDPLVYTALARVKIYDAASARGCKHNESSPFQNTLEEYPIALAIN